MNDINRFSGIITALVTPFTKTGKIDWSAFERLLDRQLEAGVVGLLPVGTTGEAATLSESETAQIIERTVKRAKGAAYILAGTGSNVTDKTVAATKRAANLGADGALVVTPYYNRPSQAGLRTHYEDVSAAVDIDIMLYSVPGRTGVEIAPEIAAALARSCRNIVAIKEAGGRPERVSDLRALCGRDFAIHCGDDSLALPFYALGACGLTSVLSNYDPEICVAAHKAWAEGDRDEALRLHEVLRPLAEAMFIENSPAPVKHILGLENAMSAMVRRPLAPVSDAARKELARVLTTFTRERKKGTRAIEMSA